MKLPPWLTGRARPRLSVHHHRVGRVSGVASFAESQNGLHEHERYVDPGVGTEPGGECPCIATAKLLEELGAAHAAAMHRKGEGHNGWTVQDWRGHIDDERVKLFPVILRVADRFAAARDYETARTIRAIIYRLEAEHVAVIRQYLDNDRLPPDAITRPHGETEDVLVTTFEREIRREAGLPQAA